MTNDTTESGPVSARLSSGRAGRESGAGSDVKTEEGNQSLRKGVQSVDHAMAILRIFTNADRELALKELADALRMPAPKVHHYLVSLVRTGILRQTDNGAYDLGPFALQLGLSSLRRIEPIELVTSAAKALRDSSGETTFISVWGSYGATIIRYFEGFQTVTVEVRAGLTLPLATSATGQVFLAWGNRQLVESVRIRENINQKKFNQIKSETRRHGLGRVDGDLLPRIAALSAPVFDHDGKLILAITQLGWSGELDTATDGRVDIALRHCAQSVCAELGYSPKTETT